MKKFLLLILLALVLFLPQRTYAASAKPTNLYFKGQVAQIISAGEVINNGQKNLYQDVKVKMDNGQTVSVHLGDPDTLTPDHEVAKGDEIILLRTSDPTGKVAYSVYDKYRTNNLFIILVIFIILIIAVAGLKGIGSLSGLLVSLCVILFFIIPQILHGADPLSVSIIGSIVILFVATYIAHGFSRQTTVALTSTFCALFITAGLAILFTNFGNLTGVGNEDIASLQIGATSIINLRGLFLAGIIIGTLGALNDVTISQSATIFELAKSEPTIKFEYLVKKGFNVGREHILSLVNTLVLAYAGSSLFIFIFIVLNPQHIPYWVILNTETISGEIISTIAGSTGLILAVPIVTLLAGYTVLNLKK